MDSNSIYNNVDSDPISNLHRDKDSDNFFLPNPNISPSPLQLRNDSNYSINQQEIPDQKLQPQDDTYYFNTMDPLEFQDSRFDSLNPVPPDTGYAFDGNISYTLPGAFKGEDMMDIDDSPPFTIELDLYFDSASTANVSYGNQQSLFPHNQYFTRQFRDEKLPGNLPTNIINTPNNGVSPNVHTDTPNNMVTPHMTPGNQFDTPEAFDQASIYSSFLNDNELERHLRHESVDSHMNGQSISVFQNGANPNYMNELSPLTTTTSLTHSVNSIHSTQPSFFSAHQYLSRPSLDVANSHRNSIDYMKHRNSIELANSNSRQPRANNNRYLSFTNSLSNYIPFMGDRNNGQNERQRQQRTSPPRIQTPSSPIGGHSIQNSTQFMNQPSVRQQPKHLIRSIFKSNTMDQEISKEMFGINPGDLENGIDQSYNSNGKVLEEDPMSSEFLVLSPKAEELDDVDPLPSSKKTKKPKRSLFNGFKAPTRQGSTEDMETNNLLTFNDESGRTSGNNSFSEDLNDSEPAILGSVSRTPSSANTVKTDNALETQPDYAALFENVGKRKKMGKTSTFKTKPKSKSKNGKDKEKIDDFIEETFSNKDLFDGRTSVSSSGASMSHSRIKEESESDSEQEHDEDYWSEHENEKSVLNTSKRILGSKLMKRKSDKKEPEIKNVKTKVISDGVEVEVDLKTLDLPETTQAYPISIINSKSRTRGRKENKEADLTDLSKIFLCTYCHRRFKRQEHLKRHFRSLHTFDKPYDCSICQKKFSRSDNLNQHLKTHKEEEAAASAAAAAAATQ